MKPMLKKILFMLSLCLCCVMMSCGPRGDSETKEQKEYASFRADSLKQCTQNLRLAETSVLSAFDKIPENNGYWKKDKVTCTYDDALQLWVATVDYHYDRNGVYYKSSVRFNVKFWAEQKGSKADVFYKIWVNPL